MSDAPKPKRSLLPPLFVGLAVLGAVALLLLRLRMEPPTVPAYVLVGDGGELQLRPGQPFRLDVDPSAEVTGAVAARGFLLRGDEVRPWDPPFTVARDGSVHLAGTVDGLFAGVPSGAWEIAIAVGRPENLPTTPGYVLRARDGASAQTAWRLVRERIVLGG